jgi:signal transduction histidine kinase
MLVIIAVAGRTIARINGPLDELLLGIDALTSGDATRRVHVRSRDEIGKVAGAFNGMADHLAAANTARERVEAELRRSNQDLDQFAYSASHDLKAPLRGIRNLTQWITEDVAGDAKEETIENLALVQNRVERLEMLLDGLLRYSRVGQAGGETEDIDVARLISEITDYISPAAGFSVDGFGDVPMIRAHKAPLEQVLRNLIGNALKHHDRDAGKVTVRTRKLGDLVEFRVEDDGPGIAPNFHDRIFGMFQTLRPRDELEGSGMGLAIVKKAVERNGGTVRVESAPPSRGTAFVFTWAKQPSPQPG